MLRLWRVGLYAEASACIDQPPPTKTAFSIAGHFASIEDHRRDQRRLHSLSDILSVAICAVVAGADGWEDIAAFGQAKQAWFEERLKHKHGTPSSDAIRRVIARIDPAEFEHCFLSWVGSLTKKIGGAVIFIDGKTFRGCYDKDDSKATLHTVSAWANRQRLVLAQRKVDGKSNEIKAIPALLEVLDVPGCIVTLDAMGTQVAIAGARSQVWQRLLIFTFLCSRPTL